MRRRVITVEEIIRLLEREVPIVLAEEWDNCGLQVGDPGWPVKEAVVSLNPTPEALQYARERNAHLLITHHPLFFKPIKNLVTSTPLARIAEQSFASGIAIYSLHTNWDSAPGGVNDALAEVLDVTVDGYLDESPTGRMAKLAVYAPREAAASIRDALFDESAGVVGRYTHCSFSVEGRGSYVPADGSRPYRGEVGIPEKADETRIEIILPRSRVSRVLDRVRTVHPYEEMAYDVYPVLNPTHRGGMGRTGTLKHPLKLAELASRVKERLGLSIVKSAGDPDRRVEKVALCGGAGSEFWKKAVEKGADVFISGEFRYHEALEATSAGLALLDAGHFASEMPGVHALAGKLKEWLHGKEAVVVTVYQNETDAFDYI